MLKQEQREQRNAVIAAYRESGQTQIAWCKEHNMSHRQLRYWLKQEAQWESSEQTSPTWIPLNVEPEEKPVKSNTLLIKIGSATIEVKPGFDEKLLLDVLKALRSLC